VTAQPTSQTVDAGRHVTFSAVAGGTPAPSVQWQMSTDGVHFSAIAGATSPIYTFTASQSESGEDFDAIITNAAGTATTSPATLTIRSAPAVTVQPISFNLMVSEGRGERSTDGARGVPPPPKLGRSATSPYSIVSYARQLHNRNGAKCYNCMRIKTFR
jgi:hypothetical protein